MAEVINKNARLKTFTCSKYFWYRPYQLLAQQLTTSITILEHLLFLGQDKPLKHVNVRQKKAFKTFSVFFKTVGSLIRYHSKTTCKCIMNITAMFLHCTLNKFRCLIISMFNVMLNSNLIKLVISYVFPVMLIDVVNFI